MNIQKKNYWIDLLMVLSFFINAISGIIIWLLYSPGGHARSVKFLWVYKYQWKIIHIWSGFLLIIFVLIHILLHKKWIMQMTKNIFLKKPNN